VECKQFCENVSSVLTGHSQTEGNIFYLAHKYLGFNPSGAFLLLHHGAKKQHTVKTPEALSARSKASNLARSHPMQELLTMGLSLLKVLATKPSVLASSCSCDMSNLTHIDHARAMTG
jgi:hypothetical protein